MRQSLGLLVTQIYKGINYCWTNMGRKQYSRSCIHTAPGNFSQILIDHKACCRLQSRLIKFIDNTIFCFGPPPHFFPYLNFQQSKRQGTCFFIWILQLMATYFFMLILDVASTYDYAFLHGNTSRCYNYGYNISSC